MSEYEYNWLHCLKCDVTRAFESHVHSGDPGYREVSCPVCGEALGEIRADLGHRYIGDLGSQFSCTAHLDARTPDEA